VSKLHTDETVTKDTTILGPAGVLAKLKGYFVDNYQSINHLEVTIGEQAREEWLRTLWEKKKADKVAARLTLLESMEGWEQRSAYVHAWILEETTRELAEKAKQQISLRPVENDEDDCEESDGTMSTPNVHGEEVTIKTVVASMVHKGNLEEAKHGTPRINKTE
jgi:hypothetical protein